VLNAIDAELADLMRARSIKLVQNKEVYKEPVLFSGVFSAGVVSPGGPRGGACAQADCGHVVGSGAGAGAPSPAGMPGGGCADAGGAPSLVGGSGGIGGGISAGGMGRGGGDHEAPSCGWCQ
jgi:hypothetical protein